MVSSQTMDWTCVPCIGRQIFYHWTTRDVSPYCNIFKSKSSWKTSMMNKMSIFKMNTESAPQVVNYSLDCYNQCVCLLSHFICVRLFVTLWVIARQAFLSLGFLRQEYWRGLPCHSPGYLPNSGIEPLSQSPTLTGSFFTTRATCQNQHLSLCFSL